jgi:hypothetical protein
VLRAAPLRAKRCFFEAEDDKGASWIFQPESPGGDLAKGRGRRVEQFRRDAPAAGAAPAPGGCSAFIGCCVNRRRRTSGRRKAAIEHYLKNAAADFAPAERAQMAQHVLTILNDLIFADLFASGSRAEVPIVGRLGREGAPALGVAGQVDRLAVTRDSVLIADYKTDRAPPGRLAEVPDRYAGQLALYRAILGGVYPGKTIRAALIFTEVPLVIELPHTVLDAALARALAR